VKCETITVRTDIPLKQFHISDKSHLPVTVIFQIKGNALTQSFTSLFSVLTK